jgi:hypothetical protein
MSAFVAKAVNASGSSSGIEKVVDLQYNTGSSAGGLSVATYGGVLVGNGTNCLMFNSFMANNIYPADAAGLSRDNVIDLGTLGTRFDDIYATNGSIQTSDRNEKQDIAELTEAERRVAQACKGLLRKFRWKSAVAEKGDDARIHFGIIAQDLADAFTAEGLDANDYAMFVKGSWEDEVTQEQRERFGVRYSELLAFIIAAM